MLCLWFSGQAQHSILERQVYFATGSAELDNDALHLLDSIVMLSDTATVRGVKMAGHTDGIGTQEANQLLSKERTLVVARYLKKRGIQTKAVRLKAFGEEQAVADNTTVAGRKLNRRVELRIYLIEEETWDDEELIGIEEEAVTGILGVDLERSQVSQPLNRNSGNYDCEAGLTVKGRRGATIEVPAHAFKDCVGRNGPISIHLKEFTRFDDVVNQDVSTMAGDTILESAGMICISAFAGRRQLDALAKGKTIKVKIPASQFDPEMRLYYSDQDRSMRDIVWRSSPSQPLSYDPETDTYLFETNDLGCINLDKPGQNFEVALPLAIKVKPRLLYHANVYVAYTDRGTFSQGKLVDDQYIVFGSVPTGENIRFKGFLSTGKGLFRMDKRMRLEADNLQPIELEGKTVNLITDINRRGIKEKKGRDRFVGGKRGFWQWLKNIFS